MVSRSHMVLIRRRLIAFFMVVVTLLTTVLPFGGTVYAEPAVGSSGSISAIGTKTNLAGGIFDMDNAVFRLSISRDSDFLNRNEEDKANTLSAFSHKYPSASSNALFFIPKDYRADADSFFPVVYNAGTRQLDQYDDYYSKRKIIQGKYNDGSKPANKIRDVILNGYQFSSGSLAKEFGDGQWETKIGDSITEDEANQVWSYILYQSGSSYNVTERANAFISSYATEDMSTLDNTQLEDIAKGYLSLLIYLWKMTPDEWRGTTATAINDYINQSGWSSTGSGKPTTIVIDTATSITLNATGQKMIIPSMDYFMYYTAVKQKYNLYDRGTVQLPEGAGDTYTMLQKIVEYSITEDGRSVNRISDSYDESNVFSFGASAIAYPYKRFSTSGNNPRWSTNTAKDAFIDVLTLGKTATGTIRGFNYIGFQPMLTPSVNAGKDIPTDDPDIENAMSNTTFAITDPKLDRVITEDDEEIIGQPIQLTLKHNESNEQAVNSWINVLDNNPYQTINVKISWEREVTDPTTGSTSNVATNTADYDKGSGNGFQVDKVWFKEWIQGTQSLVILDRSSANEPISGGQTKKYVYKPTVTFTYTNNGNEEQFVDDQINDDAVEFYRPPNPPDPIKYTSTPSAYAEVKNGSPDNEEFEAMSGVPSNKRLYLGVGGSEFIVDVELEYKENVDSVWRTYRSVFDGTESEFKAGDTAPSQSLGGQTADLHNGGTYTKSWSGSIPNNGSSATGLHSATSVAVPDRSAYDAAKAEAQALVAQINGTTLGHTSASDKKYRTQTGWSASITTDSATNPSNNTVSVACSYVAPSGDGDNGTPCGQEMATAEPSGPGSYSITVTWVVPAHVVCGPECTNDMPAIEDTWKQKVNFDYLKISRVEVYKIESGRITRMEDIFGDGTSELKASITQGEPNIFTNIAEKNANGDDEAAQSSKMGRIRYSLDMDQHDVVVYNEGTRSNKSDGMGSNGSANSPEGGGHNNSWATGILYTNKAYTDEAGFHENKGGTNTGYTNTADSKDVATEEWKKFDERRKALNTATIISDMLILQTSAGDQSVLYFDKKSETVQAQEQFPDVDATKEEMWDDNTNSAANWDKNSIIVGSYNGNYSETGDTSSSNKKYWGFRQDTQAFYSSNQTSISTAFDDNGVGVNASQTRPTRPTKLYISASHDIEPTTQNGAYATGDAEVFFERVLEWKTSNPYPGTGATLAPHSYTAEAQSNFGSQVGLVLSAPYSDNHTKVNDIVIHTPVSAEDALVVSLSEDRDQRTETPVGGAAGLIEDQNSLKVCPLDPALCEFRVLNCEYRKDVELVSIDFENATSTTILNKTTGAYIPFSSSSGFSRETLSGFGSGNVLKANGTRWSLNFSDIGLTNSSETSVLVEMDFLMQSAPTGNGTMIVSFDRYDFYVPAGQTSGTWNTGNGKEKMAQGVNLVGTPIRLGLQFSFGHIEDSKLFIDGKEIESYVRYTDSNSVEGRIGTQLNIGSWSYDSNYGAQFYIDNLTITRKGGTSEHTASCYVETVAHDTQWVHTHTSSCYVNGVLSCNNLPLNTLTQNNVHVHDENCVHDGIFTETETTTTTFDYTGTVQTFTAPVTGSYTIETWGGSGGSTSSVNTHGGKGGYSKATFNLTAGDTLLVTVGNEGSGSSADGGDSIVELQGDLTDSLAWDFTDSSTHSFRGYNMSITGTEYGLTGSVHSDNYFYSPYLSLVMQGDEYVEIVVKNNSSNTSGAIYYTTDDYPSFGEDAVVRFFMSANDSEYKTYRVKMYGSDWWSGVLRRLRFDIANGSSTGDFYVSSIKVLSSDNTELIKAEGGSSYAAGSTSGGGGSGYVNTSLGSNISGSSGVNSGDGTVTISYDAVDISSGLGDYTWEQILGSSWKSYIVNSTPDIDKIKSDITSFPSSMPDGAPNPLYGCLHYISGNTGLGAMEGANHSGTAEVDVTHPTSAVTVRALRLNSNHSVPVASSTNLGLIVGGKYTLEFDYWADSDGVNFNVDLYPDSLPEHRPTANKAVQHATFEFTSSHSDMTSAVLRFFNDRSSPNSSNVYISGIRLYMEATPNQHVCDEDCVTIKSLSCTEPHHNGSHYDGSNDICWDACEDDHNHKDKQDVQLSNGTTLINGTFINLDYGFQVYFPNIGDFAQQPQLKGISTLTTTRGKGYTDSMDTTQYTSAKRIRFGYNVIYNGTLYKQGTWISLPVNQSYYDFYVPLANQEAVAAKIEYEAIPINGRPIGDPENENYESTTNRQRHQDFTALHGAYKMSYIDIVGRIGNFVVSDTEDFRFSNLFKQALDGNEWVIEGIVKKVASNMQNQYYGDQVDLRGVAVESTGTRLNTYGTQTWLSEKPLQLPINPSDNTEPALQDQFLKPGYDIFSDISTVGNYQEGVTRVLPYYYKLDLDTGTVTPLDVYTKVDNNYEVVNQYKAADSGSVPDDIYPYGLSLDWSAESERRNYTLDESVITDTMAELHGEYIYGEVDTGGEVEEGVTGVKRLSTPLGNYVDVGTAQMIVADTKARTFIGSSKTNGSDKNPNDVLDEEDYQYGVQRWHFKLGLPSSAVFVEAGKEPTTENLESIKSGNAVILLTADIITIGNVYTLRWDQPGTSSFTVTKDGITKSFNLKNSGVPPVIALLDLNETSTVDVSVQGSH